MKRCTIVKIVVESGGTFFKSLHEASAVLFFRDHVVCCLHLAHAENYRINRTGFALTGTRYPTVQNNWELSGFAERVSPNSMIIVMLLFHLWRACQAIHENSQLWNHIFDLFR